jgi:hypothetical protein
MRTQICTTLWAAALCACADPVPDLSSTTDAISSNKVVKISSRELVRWFGTLPERGTLYDAHVDPNMEVIAQKPLGSLTAELTTGVPYDFARAYFFIHDPKALQAQRLALGSGNTTCFLSNSPLHATISPDVAPTPLTLSSSAPQPVTEQLSLADYFNPAAPAGANGGRLRAIMVADDGPCSRGVAGIDLMTQVHGTLWTKLGEQAQSPFVNSIKRHYSFAIPYVTRRDGDTPQMHHNGFMLDFSTSIDLMDPIGTPSVCATAQYAYSLLSGVTDAKPHPSAELYGGILSLTGGVASSHSDGGLGASELEAEIVKRLNSEIATGVTAAVLGETSQRQTQDVFQGKHPTNPAAKPLVCEVGDVGACGVERLVLKEAVRRAIDKVFRDPSMHALLPSWYWADFPAPAPADWDAYWDKYSSELQAAIDQSLSLAALDLVSPFGKAEHASRTGLRNWRCVHDATRDDPGLGRCEVVLRGKRLSRKPGGFNLVWFDNPWQDHVNKDGSVSDAAINIALWVAAHAPTGDETLDDPDDIPAATAELCASPPPGQSAFAVAPSDFLGAHTFQ